MALGRSMPPSSNHSSMLSRLCESDRASTPLRRSRTRPAAAGAAPQRACANGGCLDAVDLAVVGEPPERMRQRPARQGVGGKALVEHHPCAARRGRRVEEQAAGGRSGRTMPLAPSPRRQPDHVEVGLIAQCRRRRLRARNSWRSSASASASSPRRTPVDGRHRRPAQPPAGRRDPPAAHTATRADGGEFGVRRLRQASARAASRGRNTLPAATGACRPMPASAASWRTKPRPRAAAARRSHRRTARRRRPAAVRHARQRVQGDVDDRAEPSPATCAIRPKPQLSCSLAGSYEPHPDRPTAWWCPSGWGGPWRTAPRHRFIRIDHNLCGATTACDGEKTVTKETT